MRERQPKLRLSYATSFPSLLSAHQRRGYWDSVSPLLLLPLRTRIRQRTNIKTDFLFASYTLHFYFFSLVFSGKDHVYIVTIMCLFSFFRAGSVGDTKKMGWKSKKGWRWDPWISVLLGNLAFLVAKELLLLFTKLLSFAPKEKRWMMKIELALSECWLKLHG